MLAAVALQEFEVFDSQTQAKKNVVRAIETMAEQLGNTPSIYRKCYVHPAMINTYLEASLAHTLKQHVEQEMAETLHKLRSEEAAVMALPQQHLVQAESQS